MQSHSRYTIRAIQDLQIAEMHVTGGGRKRVSAGPPAQFVRGNGVTERSYSYSVSRFLIKKSIDLNPKKRCDEPERHVLAVKNIYLQKKKNVILIYTQYCQRYMSYNRFQ